MSVVRYYLPLFPRPRFVVTYDMVRKLNEVEIDITQAKIINEHKKLYDNLIVGDELMVYSKHLTSGTIVRAIVYSTCLILLKVPIIIGAMVIYAYIVGSFQTISKNSELDKKYKAFMNE